MTSFVNPTTALCRHCGFPKRGNGLWLKRFYPCSNIFADEVEGEAHKKVKCTAGGKTVWYLFIVVWVCKRVEDTVIQISGGPKHHISLHFYWVFISPHMLVDKTLSHACQDRLLWDGWNRLYDQLIPTRAFKTALLTAGFPEGLCWFEFLKPLVPFWRYGIYDSSSSPVFDIK